MKHTTNEKPFRHGLTGYGKHRCRCTQCRQAWREHARKTRGYKPSHLANEVVRLTNEIDAMELNLDALRSENAMLWCRLEELGETP